MSSRSGLDAQITGAFDRLIKELEGIKGAGGLFVRRAYWEQYRRAHRIAEQAAAGGRMLDWGAGVGHFGYVQKQLGVDVTAYSVEIGGAGPYESVLKELTALAGITHETSPDPVLLPFPDGSFDVAVSCGVLEHVREFGGDDQASLLELARVLRRGGKFLCFHLPNRFSASENLRRRIGRSHHAFTYDTSEFEKLAGVAGLGIDKSFSYGLFPANTIAGKLSGQSAQRLTRVDELLTKAVGPISQNHGFVCTKR